MGQALISRIVQQQAEQQVSAVAAEAGVPQNPDAAWWLKLLARGVGVIGAVVAILSGVACIVVNIIYPQCIIGGLLELLLAVVVLVFEAPVCCAFIKYTKPIAEFAEKRTYLHKAIIYCVASVITFLFCWGLSTLFGCGLIFAAGVLYGIMGIGKKGDRQQMMDAAAADANRPPAGAGPEDARSGLIYNDDMGRAADPFAGQKSPAAEPQRWNY